ncbi:MAG TPA: S8 family serine peptidase [Allosphingosinicella sp.]|nr:S8 family serine peptidase [Allosphingosinicella sp.]
MILLMTILRRWRLAWSGALLLGAASAGAQLVPGLPGGSGGTGGVGRPSVPSLPTAPTPGVPGVGDRIGDVTSNVRGAIDPVTGRLDPVRASASELAAARIYRLDELVRANRERLEMTDFGPAVRGQVIAVDPDPATLHAALTAGFTRVAEERIEGLDIRSVTLAVPRGWSVNRALSRLRRLAPAGRFSANNLHEQSGGASAAGDAALLVQRGGAPGSAIGIIDGGVAAHPSLRSAVQQRGFVAGAPRASAHGTAMASLIAGQGPVRGAAPGTPLLVADIFGADPAGGNALALTRALGWMVAQRVRVVAVSLVGAANPLIERAVQQARARGTWVVAAVGNDGRAAPPAFPASYPGVIAVTAVDGRGRVLIEAGRALHLDYAAPGADMGAAGGRGAVVAVRGTSFAVPLVAGRLAQHIRAANVLASLDGEAAQRGARGVGRGILCGNCRTPIRNASRR